MNFHLDKNSYCIFFRRMIYAQERIWVCYNHFESLMELNSINKLAAKDNYRDLMKTFIDVVLALVKDIGFVYYTLIFETQLYYS